MGKKVLKTIGIINAAICLAESAVGFAKGEEKVKSLINENATCIQECHCVNKNYTAEGKEIHDRLNQQYGINFRKDLFLRCFDEGVKKMSPIKKKIYDINSNFKNLLSDNYTDNEGETYTALIGNLRDFNNTVDEVKNFDPLPIAQNVYNKSLTITLGKKEKYELEKCMGKDTLTPECREKFGRSLRFVGDIINDGVHCAQKMERYKRQEIIEAGKRNRTQIRKGQYVSCPECKPCEKCKLF